MLFLKAGFFFINFDLIKFSIENHANPGCREGLHYIPHTKQDWSHFGSRSGAIPSYLIQHRGGSFYTMCCIAPGGAIMAP